MENNKDETSTNNKDGDSRGTSETKLNSEMPASEKAGDDPGISKTTQKNETSASKNVSHVTETSAKNDTQASDKAAGDVHGKAGTKTKEHIAKTKKKTKATRSTTERDPERKNVLVNSETKVKVKSEASRDQSQRGEEAGEAPWLSVDQDTLVVKSKQKKKSASSANAKKSNKKDQNRPAAGHESRDDTDAKQRRKTPSKSSASTAGKPLEGKSTRKDSAGSVSTASEVRRKSQENAATTTLQLSRPVASSHVPRSDRSAVEVVSSKISSNPDSKLVLKKGGRILKDHDSPRAVDEPLKTDLGTSADTATPTSSTFSQTPECSRLKLTQSENKQHAPKSSSECNQESDAISLRPKTQKDRITRSQRPKEEGKQATDSSASAEASLAIGGHLSETSMGDNQLKHGPSRESDETLQNRPTGAGPEPPSQGPPLTDKPPESDKSDDDDDPESGVSDDGDDDQKDFFLEEAEIRLLRKAEEEGDTEDKTENKDEDDDDDDDDDVPESPDDAWFEQKLMTLPTMFQLQDIVNISRSRLLSRVAMAKKALVSLIDEVEDAEVIIERVTVKKDGEIHIRYSVIRIMEIVDHNQVVERWGDLKSRTRTPQQSSDVQDREQKQGDQQNAEASERVEDEAIQIAEASSQRKDSGIENTESSMFETGDHSERTSHKEENSDHRNKDVNEIQCEGQDDELNNQGQGPEDKLQKQGQGHQGNEILSKGHDYTIFKFLRQVQGQDEEVDCISPGTGRSEKAQASVPEQEGDEAKSSPMSSSEDNCNEGLEKVTSREGDQKVTTDKPKPVDEMITDSASELVYRYIYVVTKNRATTPHENDEGERGKVEATTNTTQTSDGTQKKDGHSESKIRKGCPAVFRRAEYVPRTHVFGNFLVVLDWLLDRKSKAEEDGRRMVRLYPYCFIAKSNLFYVLWKLGDREGAVQVLRPLWNMKKRRPRLYKLLMDRELGHLGSCYTELGPDFIPDAVAVLEKALASHPTWYGQVWSLALNYRRHSSHAGWGKTRLDPTFALLRAFELQLKLLKSGTRTSGAASELGNILEQCELHGETEAHMEILRRAKEEDLTALKCVDIIMSHEHGCFDLVRAGKIYRDRNQLQQSYDAIKKAIEERKYAKGHHQMALTLKKMVRQDYARQSRDERTQRERDRPSNEAGLDWRRSYDALQQPSPVEHRRPPVIRRMKIPRPDARMVRMERILKVLPSYNRLSRENEHVRELLEHLHACMQLSEGENHEASFDLGQTYKELGEYNDALDQCIKILDQNPEPQNVCRAFEHCGMVFVEQFQNDDHSDVRFAQTYLDKANAAFTIAILSQARELLHSRRDASESDPSHPPSVWENLHTLAQFLRLPDRRYGDHRLDDQVCHEKLGDDQSELWLLRLLWVYADTLPVLTSLQQVMAWDANNPLTLRSNLLKAIQNQRYDEAIILASIYHLLTGEDRTGLKALGEEPRSRSGGGAGGAGGGEHAVVAKVMKAFVLAARGKLLDDVKEGLIVGSFTLNRSTAHRLFRWAFQDSYPDTNRARRASSSVESDQTSHSDPPDTNRDSQEPEPALPNAASDNPSTSSNKRRSKRRAPVPDEDDDDEAENDAESLVAVGGTSTYHVTIIHEAHEQQATRAARFLYGVLQHVCGLKVWWLGDDKRSDEEKMKEALRAVDQARVVVCFFGTGGMMPAFENAVRHVSARAASNCRSVATLTLDPTVTLPASLKNCRSFLWKPELAIMPDGLEESQRWLDLLCAIFGFLADIDMTV